MPEAICRDHVTDGQNPAVRRESSLEVGGGGEFPCRGNLHRDDAPAAGVEKRVDQCREIALEHEHFVPGSQRQPRGRQIDPGAGASGDHNLFRLAPRQLGAQLPSALWDLKVLLASEAERVDLLLKDRQERSPGPPRKWTFARSVEIDGLGVKVEGLADPFETGHFIVLDGP